MHAAGDGENVVLPHRSGPRPALASTPVEPVRLLVLSSELPPGGYGSATALGQFLAASERHTDWHVQVVAPASRRRDTAPSWDGVKVHRTPCCEHADGLRHSRLRLARFPVDAVVRSVQLDPSVVLSWQALPAGVAGAVLARRLRVPHVARLSGPELATRPGVTTGVRRLVLRHLLDTAGGVVAKSEQEVDAIREAGYRGETRLIPNVAHPSPAWTRRACGGAVRLLVVSRLVPGKAVGLVLDALLLLELRAPGKFTVTVAGDGPLGATLRAQARHGQLPVMFLGRVPREHMTALYTDHDVLVHPSEWEGSCNAALEALNVGLPVIGRASALRDVVRDGEDGLLLTRPSASELAEVVHDRRWSALPRRQRRRHGRTGRDLVADYDALFTALTRAGHP